MRKNLRVCGFFKTLYDHHLRPNLSSPGIIRRSHYSSDSGLDTVKRPQLGFSCSSKIAFFSTSNLSTDGIEEVNGDYSRDFGTEKYLAQRTSVGAGPSSNLSTILRILLLPCAQERSRKLDECTVNVTSKLVEQVISRTRNNWEAAFTFFLWAGKRLGNNHLLRDYHSMIAILGKFRKFDTAWSLINDMKALSLVTPHTLMIMIRKYAAVHDVARAVNAFYGFRRFNFEIRIVEFHGLLSALCRYKNVKDAEDLLLCNESVFPLSTKSFNIILNGYCNVVGDLCEGRRVWIDMEKRGIKPDVYSYSSIISSYSKVNNMKAVMKLYKKMQDSDIAPDRKVYNAVIHALAKEKLLTNALELMKTMEEKGIPPDSVTYNSLIVPLCRQRLLDEAKRAFDEMVSRGLLPTIRSFHAFFHAIGSGDEVFELLERMYELGCDPSHETYIMLIRKFCRWRELGDVYKLWDTMVEKGLDPDRSSYTVLIHGLFWNGRLDDAYRFYLEMKKKDLLPEPATDAMVQRWLDGKEDRYKLPYLN